MNSAGAVSAAHRHYRSLLWAILLLSALPASLLASWQLLVSADFLYPLWYEVIGIDRTIAEYGPKNRYRDHFELTTRDERSRLFAAIVAAIHDGGRGLETLTYHDTGAMPSPRCCAHRRSPTCATSRGWSSGSIVSAWEQP